MKSSAVPWASGWSSTTHIHPSAYAARTRLSSFSKRWSSSMLTALVPAFDSRRCQQRQLPLRLSQVPARRIEVARFELDADKSPAVLEGDIALGADARKWRKHEIARVRPELYRPLDDA